MKKSNFYWLFIYILVFSINVFAQPEIQELYKRANEHFKAKRWDDAIRDLNEITRVRQDVSGVFYLRALCYVNKYTDEPKKTYADEARISANLKPGEVPPKSQNILNAIADFTKAIEVNPKDSFAALYHRATVYRLEKDPEKAIADYEKFLQIYPNYQANPMFKDAKDWLIKTSNDYAEKLYMQALNVNIAVSNIEQTEKYLSDEKLAETQKLKERRREEARNLFLKVIQISHPNNVLSFSHRAGAYSSIENWNAAISDYNEILKLRIEISTIVKRAKAYDKIGQTQTAINELNRVISMPNVEASEKFYQNESLLERAKIFVNQGKLNEALADFDKAIVNNPKYLYAYFERGKLHAKRGNKQLARADFVKASESTYLIADSQEQIDILDGKKKPKTESVNPAKTDTNISNNLSQLIWRKTNPTNIVSLKQILGFNSPNGLNFLCRADYAGGVYPGIVLQNKCNIGYAGKAVVLENYEVYLPADNPNFELISKEGEKYAVGRESNGTPVYLCYLTYQNWWLPGKIVNGNCNYTWQGIEYYSKSFNYGYVSARNNTSEKKIDGTIEALEGEVWLNKGDAADKIKNYAEALSWYRKASEKGYERAIYNIGTYYYSGFGVEQNYAEAMIWFKIAAKKGYGKAMFNIAVMYYNGQGIVKNNTEAVYWFREAALKGIQEAKDSLKKMNVSETATEVDSKATTNNNKTLGKFETNVGFYEGEVQNGKPNGKGKIILKDGSGTYEGDWVNGMIQGKGSLISANGDKYVGDFVNAKKAGKGTLTLISGEKYEGDWLNNQRQGKGILFDKAGKILYSGCFLEDKPQPKDKSCENKVDGSNSNIKSAETIFKQGDELYKKKQYTSAIVEYTKAIELNPELINAYKNRGISYYYRAFEITPGRVDEKDLISALNDFNKVTEMNPSFAIAYWLRGEVYLKQRKYQIALQEISKAIELDPNNRNFYVTRASVYLILGEEEKMKADNKKADELKANKN